MDSFGQNSNSYCRPNKNLTNEERQEIYQALLVRSDGQKLKRGSIGEVAAMFSVSKKTFHRIWSRGKACIAMGLKANVSSRLQGRAGRK